MAQKIDVSKYYFMSPGLKNSEPQLLVALTANGFQLNF